MQTKRYKNQISIDYDNIIMFINLSVAVKNFYSGNTTKN